MQYQSVFILGLAAFVGLVFSNAPAHARGLEIEFDVAEVFFELNHTDGDLGIHALIDGEPWRSLEIENVSEREILDIVVKSTLRKQGLTEIFFESAEPTFDELSPKRFFRRFPPGEYEVEGRTLDGIELESETELTHVMPAPPAPTINGLPMAMQCDDEEPGYDATNTAAPVVIAWPAVTMSHPDARGAGVAVQPPVAIEVYNYELVVEADIEIGGEEFTTVMSVMLPPGARSVTVPEAFLALTDEFKYEVLVREASFNQTAVESCFVLEDD